MSELNFKLDSNSAFAPLPSSFAPTGEFEAASNDELDSKIESMEIELAVIAAPSDATKNGFQMLLLNPFLLHESLNSFSKSKCQLI